MKIVFKKSFRKNNVQNEASQRLVMHKSYTDTVKSSVQVELLRSSSQTSCIHSFLERLQSGIVLAATGISRHPLLPGSEHCTQVACGTTTKMERRSADDVELRGHEPQRCTNRLPLGSMSL
jgi:hypothetical protein